MIHRRRLLAAAAAIAAVAAVVSYASAAALSVSAATLTSVTVGNPCADTATTGNPVGGSTATTVNVTLPPGCVVTSRTVQVTVVDSGGAHSSAPVVMSGSTQAFTVSPAYTASATVTPSVTVDGWNLPTTWTYLPPATGVIVAGNGDTELTVGDWFTSGTLTCVRVAPFVTEGNKTWRINVNTASAPFDGAAPVFTGQDAAKVTTIGAPGDWQLVGGIPPYDKLQQVQDVPLVFNICG